MNEDRKAKLAQLREKQEIKKVPIVVDGQPFIDALEAKVGELTTTLDLGVDLNASELITELERVESLAPELASLKQVISDLVIPEMPKSVKVTGLDSLVGILRGLPREKIDLSPLTLVTDAVGSLISKIDEITVPKQGQKPEDYVPMRRVMQVGGRLLYDDSHYTGGGGGGANDFVDSNNRPTQVKLNADGSVPVDATLTGAFTNDGTFATPARQDTGNTSLASIKTDLDEIAVDTDNLALIKAKTDNLDVALSTRLKPADTLTKVTTVDTITNPVAVTGTFYQATQPVSGTVSTLEGTGLVPKVYDALTYTNTSSTVDTYKYYASGIAGSLVATLTVTWTDSTKTVLTSVVRT